MRFQIKSIQVLPNGESHSRIRVDSEPGDDLDKRGLSALDVLIGPSNLPAVRSTWILTPGEEAPGASFGALVRHDDQFDPILLARTALFRFLEAH